MSVFRLSSQLLYISLTSHIKEYKLNIIRQLRLMTQYISCGLLIQHLEFVNIMKLVRLVQQCVCLVQQCSCRMCILIRSVLVFDVASCLSCTGKSICLTDIFEVSTLNNRDFRCRTDKWRDRQKDGQRNRGTDTWI